MILNLVILESKILNFSVLLLAKWSRTPGKIVCWPKAGLREKMFAVILGISDMAYHLFVYLPYCFYKRVAGKMSESFWDPMYRLLARHFHPNFGMSPCAIVSSLNLCRFNRTFRMGSSPLALNSAGFILWTTKNCYVIWMLTLAFLSKDLSHFFGF